MSAPAAADPLDRVGADTLEVMSAAPRYNAWQYRRIAPFLGRRVCEIGSGIGNMSALLAARPLERLVLTDTDPYYRDVLRDRFRDPLGGDGRGADAARSRGGRALSPAMRWTPSSPST